MAPLYKHDVVDVYTLRKALDVLAIELYIGRATKASIQQMADAFDAMEELIISKITQKLPSKTRSFTVFIFTTRETAD